MTIVNYIRNTLALLFLLVAAIPFIISALLSTSAIKAKVRQVLLDRLTPAKVAFPTARVEERDVRTK